jgi:hypothetical protein
LCKLDLEKMYDHVNWEFALFVKEMRICGEMEALYRAMYFYGGIFHSCEWNTVRIVF